MLTHVVALNKVKGSFTKCNTGVSYFVIMFQSNERMVHHAALLLCNFCFKSTLARKNRRRNNNF